MHFTSRMAKLVAVLLYRRDEVSEPGANNTFTREEKREAFSVAAKVCSGRWDEINSSIVLTLKGILPVKTVNYDLIRDPSRYVKSTLCISKWVGEYWGGVSFMPTRRANVPCTL